MTIRGRKRPLALTDAQKQMIRDMAAAGRKASEIANEVGCHAKTVRRHCGSAVCREDGCAKSARVAGRCRSHYEQLPKQRPRLSAEEREQVVARIHQLAAEGHTQSAVAVEVGMSRTFVRRVLDAATPDTPEVEPPPCVHACGRPIHYRPAIACSSERLEACPGISEPLEGAA